MAGIYLHIPFCKKACNYCNFHFSTSSTHIADMVQAVAAEAAQREAYLPEPVETIYFGGGTPSLLNDAQLQHLLSAIKNHYTIAPAAEITLEANPDDISAARLTGWNELGVNRLSIGVQSFFDEDLRWMNRAHNGAQSLAAIELAKKHGFSNITIDLIYGIPALSDARWIQNIDTALDLGIPHLSCYALTVEPKTALEKMIAKHQAMDTDPDQQASHFEILVDRLTAAGFEHYEISNFAMPGFRSRHNSSYWQGKNYLGLGPSAHSFNGKSRRWNVANNIQYIEGIKLNMPVFETETLSSAQQLNEYIMTALRTVEGIQLNKIQDEWGEENARRVLSIAQKHIDAGKIIFADNRLRLTSGGKFLADGIAADLFAEPSQE